MKIVRCRADDGPSLAVLVDEGTVADAPARAPRPTPDVIIEPRGGSDRLAAGPKARGIRPWRRP
ncbi:hypothetical protein [Pseudofrankia asymbiotica]|uniref:Uncharacterized protein n=1 Tax=Pseudofrankia asymbiotica TaxID=1834516 RepID=A0A1V2I1M5_9ACTN|nr:hypothetical protein [Pseudofrankia asymbiotica]ONH23624.1 hypothetical protein BL253_32540 [Pseudofrankia asymbiotica]